MTQPMDRIELAPNVWMLRGYVNLYVILTNDGLLLIDTGFQDNAANVISALRGLPEIRHIIISHCHTDHAGCLAELARKTNAHVYMHRLDAAFIAQGKSVPPGTKPSRLASIFNGIWVLIAHGTKIEPWRKYTSLSDGDVIPLVGGIRVHHLPGHSDGMIGLSFTASDGTRILFASDTVMNTRGLQFPYVFIDKKRGKRSMKKLTNLATDADLMVFGHGEPLKAPYPILSAYTERF